MIGNTISIEKGRESVAIVISIGVNDISVMQLSNAADVCHLSNYSSFRGNWRELFVNSAESGIKNPLLQIIKNFNGYETEKYYVLLVGSCGLIYKTIDIPVSVIADEDILSDESIEQLKLICMSNLPMGYAKTDFAVSVGSMVLSANKMAYYVNCAYVPKLLVEGIKEMLKENSLALFDIQPLAFCIQRAIRLEAPAILDIASGYISMTKEGGIIIAKYGSEAVKMQLLDYTKKHTNSILRANYDFRIITGHELRNHLKRSLTTMISMADENWPLVIGAVGITHWDGDDSKGEKLSDYFEKVKLIFKR